MLLSTVIHAAWAGRRRVSVHMIHLQPPVLNLGHMPGFIISGTPTAWFFGGFTFTALLSYPVFFSSFPPPPLHHCTSPIIYSLCRSLLVSSRPDPLHQWAERQHPPPGRHTAGAHSQQQLDSGFQSADHHTSPHDVRQRGEPDARERRPCVAIVPLLRFLMLTQRIARNIPCVSTEAIKGLFSSI